MRIHRLKQREVTMDPLQEKIQKLISTYRHVERYGLPKLPSAPKPETGMGETITPPKPKFAPKSLNPPGSSSKIKPLKLDLPKGSKPGSKNNQRVLGYQNHRHNQFMAAVNQKVNEHRQAQATPEPLPTSRPDIPVPPRDVANIRGMEDYPLVDNPKYPGRKTRLVSFSRRSPAHQARAKAARDEIGMRDYANRMTLNRPVNMTPQDEYKEEAAGRRVQNAGAMVNRTNKSLEGRPGNRPGSLRDPVSYRPPKEKPNPSMTTAERLEWIHQMARTYPDYINSYNTLRRLHDTYDGSPQAKDSIMHVKKIVDDHHKDALKAAERMFDRELATHNLEIKIPRINRNSVLGRVVERYAVADRQKHLHAKSGGEMGSDGIFYPGGKYFPKGVRGTGKGAESLIQGDSPHPSNRLDVSSVAGKAAKFKPANIADVPVMQFSPVRPSEFMAARSKCEKSPFLSEYTEEDLHAKIKEGGKIFLSKDKTTGYIIDGKGDLQNVFKAPGGPKNAGIAVVADAIANGAKTLDCYDGYLPYLYNYLGFQATDAWEWDDQYAPPGWNFQTYGRPDVIFMRYEGGTRNRKRILQRLGRHKPYVNPRVERARSRRRVERFASGSNHGRASQATGQRSWRTVGEGQRSVPQGSGKIHSANLSVKEIYAKSDKQKHLHAIEGGEFGTDGLFYPGGEYFPKGVRGTGKAYQMPEPPSVSKAEAANQANKQWPSWQKVSAFSKKSTGKGKRFRATWDMFPEEFLEFIDDHDIASIKSKEDYDRFMLMYNASINNNDGHLPTRDELKAFAAAGEGARGEYAKAFSIISSAIGADNAVLWSGLNAVMSANTAYEQHTFASMKLLRMWVEEGKPGDDAGISKLLDRFSKEETMPSSKGNRMKVSGMLMGSKLPKVVALLKKAAKGEIIDKKDIAGSGRDAGQGKTPGFFEAFVSRMGGAFDTHMAKLTNPNLGPVGLTGSNSLQLAQLASMDNYAGSHVAKQVKLMQQEIMSDPTAYGAYRAAVGKAAKDLGWAPREAQEAIWAAIISSQVLKTKGFTNDQILANLTHTTANRAWSMTGLLSHPEMFHAIADIGKRVRPSFSERDLEASISRGKETGKAAESPLGTADPSHQPGFFSGVRRLDRTVSAGKGVNPVLPSGKELPRFRTGKDDENHTSFKGMGVSNKAWKAAKEKGERREKRRKKKDKEAASSTTSVERYSSGPVTIYLRPCESSASRLSPSTKGAVPQDRLRIPILRLDERHVSDNREFLRLKDAVNKFSLAFAPVSVPVTSLSRYNSRNGDVWLGAEVPGCRLVSEGLHTILGMLKIPSTVVNITKMPILKGDGPSVSLDMHSAFDALILKRGASEIVYPFKGAYPHE